MKMLGFVIFFTIFFSIYTAGNFYVFNRGLQALEGYVWQKHLYIYLFIFLWLSFIVSRFTGHTHLFTFHHVLTWAGSFWLLMVLYFFLLVVAIDIVRIFNYFIHFLPEKGTLEYIKLKRIVFFSAILIVCILSVYGHINAVATKISRLKFTSYKSLNGEKKLKVGLVTDIHLGTLVGKDRLEKLVSIMDKERPDLILLAGDLLDEAQEPILNEDIGSPLRKLSAPHGVYAIPGNHEYIGGIHRALAYIKSLGIEVLKDSTVNPYKGLVIIGRDDIQSGRFSDGEYKRKKLKELIKDVDTSCFTILMDHQPYNLGDAASNNIDLQVSGHTHNGQFWPFNYVTNAIFEVSHGYKKKENTHFYVSNGFGTWGPPIRIGNRPEVAFIEIEFEK